MRSRRLLRDPDNRRKLSISMLVEYGAKRALLSANFGECFANLLRHSQESGQYACETRNFTGRERGQGTDDSFWTVRFVLGQKTLAEYSWSDHPQGAELGASGRFEGDRNRRFEIGTRHSVDLRDSKLQALWSIVRGLTSLPPNRDRG